MVDVSQLQREIQSLGRQLHAGVVASVVSSSSAGPDLGLALRVGARVLDLVTGQEGVIVDGTADNIIVATAG